MTDVHIKTRVERTRKPHLCAECERRIAAGNPAVIASGISDGSPYRQYAHVDCDAVAVAYAEQFDAWGEDAVRLHELFEVDELQWLIGEHSIVAERLRADARLAARKEFWRDFVAFEDRRFKKEVAA